MIHTQPPIFNGTENEYRPKGGDALNKADSTCG